MKIWGWWRRRKKDHESAVDWDHCLRRIAELQRDIARLDQQQHTLAANLMDCFNESELIARGINARLRHVPKQQSWWYS